MPEDNASLLPAVIMEPRGEAKASVIWLHGLGADGHDFAPIVPELGVDDLAVRFIFPHAPQQPVSINNGYVMRAWYDIISADFSQRQDESGVRASERLLRALIEQELAQGISSERIVLAGFSQGGAIVLHTGLRYPKPLAGIMALSTYLPLAEQVAGEVHAANADTPVFLAHGEYDPLIPLALADNTRQQLQDMGHAVEWHHYPMEHTVCDAEIQAISAWLRDRFRA
jgi:phospholipase/carboxylesterase